MKYAFQLGHQPHIAIAEIDAVFAVFSIVPTSKTVVGDFLIVETADTLPVQQFMHRLGSTVAIHEYISPAHDIENTIADYLENNEGKIHFSVASKNKKLGLAIKKELKARGKSVRYIEPKNTATIIHNKLVEKKSNFIIIQNELFVTVAIQDIEGFTKRDYERPGADNKSGMLPPKLARTMLNLSGADFSAKLLDPFCGSGTVLLEAIDLGFANVTGTDISEKAIADTKQNLDWFYEHGVPGCDGGSYTTAVGTADAQKLKAHFADPPQAFDLIVTEPYMGNPLHGNESQKDLESQAGELARLYSEAFRSFHAILNPGGIVIFVIPQFSYENEWVKVNCVQSIKKTGFKRIPFSDKHATLLYHRPQQHLGREIFKFRKI